MRSQPFSVLYRERTSNLYWGDKEIYKQQVDKMGYQFLLRDSPVVEIRAGHIQKIWETRQNQFH